MLRLHVALGIIFMIASTVGGLLGAAGVATIFFYLGLLMFAVALVSGIVSLRDAKKWHQ